MWISGERRKGQEEDPWEWVIKIKANPVVIWPGTGTGGVTRAEGGT